MTLTGKDILEHTTIPEGLWVGKALEVARSNMVFIGVGMPTMRS